MIGQLLHSLNASGSRRGTNPRAAQGLHNPLASSHQLDSVTEDAHTQGLLFPDVADILHDRHESTTSAALSFPRPNSHGLDSPRDLSASLAELLESPRDVRILVAQGETGSLQELILFDSKPPPTTPASPRHSHSRQGSRTSIVSPIPEDAYRRSPTSAFQQRARLRRASAEVPSPQEDPFGRERTGKEADDIPRIALGVMFENQAYSYKGTGNKIHIVPLASRPYDHSITSTSLNNEFAMLGMGRALSSRKPSSLSKSHTPADPPPDTSFVIPDHTTRSAARRRTVLVTRTFSTTWVDESPANGHTRGSNSSRTAPSQDSRGKPIGPSPQRSMTYRSPMYAITIVLQLPVASTEQTPPSSRFGTFGRRPLRKGSSSQNSHMSPSSSYDSDKRGYWFGSDMFGSDSIHSASATSDVDDKVDLIGQHWEAISRTLNMLQALVQKKVIEQLRPLAQQGKPVKLFRNSLANDQDLRNATEEACSRVIRAMIIPRVRTGQGRWGLWREEARWLDRWAGGKEHNYFLTTLLSAFLGTHTDWISMLSRKLNSLRQKEFQKQARVEDFSLPSRTVIVADKMAARRLIFFLSAFLPPNYPILRGDVSPRPSTAASRGYSQSPPYGAPISRQESLRRAINKRGKGSISRARGHGSRASSITATAADVSFMADERTEMGTIRPGSGAGTESPSRRSSMDARSIIRVRLTSNNLEAVDPSLRKSSATTTSTATPGSAVPVAHFAVRRQGSMSGRMTPEIGETPGGSVAETNLINTLHRSTSNATSDSGGGQWSPRWAGLKNLWNIGGSRRGSTTEYSDILQASDEGLGIMGLRGSMSTPTRPDMLGLHRPPSQSIDDKSPTDEALPSPAAFSSLSHDFPQPESTASPEPLQPTSVAGGAGEPSTQHHHRSDSTRPIDVPLKTTVNARDGVIDVEIPLPDLPSPLLLSPGGASHSGFFPLGPAQHHHQPSTTPPNSSRSSPLSHSSYLSSSLPPICLPHSTFSPSTSFPPSSTPTSCSVAGWLHTVHPDFALQAVRPSAGFLPDVKRVMRAEPTPPTLSTSISSPPASEDHTHPAQQQPPPHHHVDNDNDQDDDQTTTSATGRWITVCTTIVADTATWSVRRLHLRRLVRPTVRPQPGKSVLTTTPTTPTAPSLPISHPQAQTQAQHGSAYYSASASAPFSAALHQHGHPHFPQHPPHAHAHHHHQNPPSASSAVPSSTVTAPTSAATHFSAEDVEVLDERIDEERLAAPDACVESLLRRVVGDEVLCVRRLVWSALEGVVRGVTTGSMGGGGLVAEGVGRWWGGE